MGMFSAEIRYASNDKLCLRGRCTGEGAPEYQFREDSDFDIEVSLRVLLDEAYEDGIYGAGSPGQVRDMLHAMNSAASHWGSLYKVFVPDETEEQAEREAEAELVALLDGIFL